MMNTPEYDQLMNRVVVVDVAPPVVYIGTLSDASSHLLVLCDVDAHELAGASVSKEVYIMEAARNGVQPNRKRVYIKQSQVLSLSALEDIILY